MYLKKPFLLFFTSLTKFSSIYALTFLILSLHIQTTALNSSQDTHPCFHFLYISLFSLSLSCRSLLSHADQPPPLLSFFCWGIESSCAVRRLSLKSCQLCYVPVPSRTLSQEIPPCSSLSSQNFALLKFRVLTLLFATPALLQITNSTTAWSLQHFTLTMPWIAEIVNVG